jgi:hypothetical protein
VQPAWAVGTHVQARAAKRASPVTDLGLQQTLPCHTKQGTQQQQHVLMDTRMGDGAGAQGRGAGDREGVSATTTAFFSRSCFSLPPFASPMDVPACGTSDALTAVVGARSQKKHARTTKVCGERGRWRRDGEGRGRAAGVPSKKNTRVWEPATM